MSSENKNLIRGMYDAFQRGDIDAILRNVTDDFEWNAPSGTPYSGIRHGREAFRDFIQAMSRSIRFDQFDVDDMVAENDKVVVIGRQRATALETGRHFESPWVHVYTIRGGKAASGLSLADTHAAASVFGESTREREALTGPLGITHPTFSGRETPE